MCTCRPFLSVVLLGIRQCCTLPLNCGFPGCALVPDTSAWTQASFASSTSFFIIIMPVYAKIGLTPLIAFAPILYQCPPFVIQVKYIIGHNIHIVPLSHISFHFPLLLRAVPCSLVCSIPLAFGLTTVVRIVHRLLPTRNSALIVFLFSWSKLNFLLLLLSSFTFSNFALRGHSSVT